MTEKEMSGKFQDFFSKWFHIETEVNPVGSTKRLDLLLTLKTSKDYVYGIELKRPSAKQGNEVEKWLNQAQGYSRCNFNIRGYPRAIPILIYPALSSMFFQKDLETEPVLIKGVEYYKPKHDKLHEHSNVNIFTGMMNLGEVRKITRNERTGYAFIFRNQNIWFEHGYPVQQHNKNYKKYFPIYKQNLTT